jgi:3-oxoadipate enol-lactonase
VSARSARRGRVRLAYDLRGEGPVVLLLQGLGMAGGMWLALPGGLLKSGLCVVVPDNRGAGASSSPLPPYSMHALADDAAAVLEDAGRGPAVVVGISLGGMIAQRLALRRPDLVRGLVLCATTCGLPHGRFPRVSFLALVGRAATGDAGAVRALHGLLVGPGTLERSPGLFTEWERTAASLPFTWRGFLGQLAAAATHSTGFELGRLRCPVEVVAGSEDRIIPPENSRVLAERIPGARLTLIPGAGHAFPLEARRALPDAIRRVLARLDERYPESHRL